ncbi:MAG: RIP metalloprotease RseP [Pseudomonadaceae bacterium]|nr:RIP metalloprotease RseP [Pseudomonadaceae bacterium]
MQILFYLLSFLAALGILVAIHELGHYLIARLSGVHITRFAIGFGRPLFTMTDKRGTEFSLAAIPLGGYVRMLDEREGPVPQALAERSFNRLSVWWRMAIAFGGPIANFLLAIFAYWLVFVAGTLEYVPVIDELEEGSPAAVAGLEPGRQIVAVDGTSTQTWQQINLAMAARLGESGEITLTTEAVAGGTATSTSIPISDWLRGADEPDFFAELGIKPAVNVPVLGEVISGGAAERAGLRYGDRIVSAGDEAIDSWSGWVSLVQDAAGQNLPLTIERNGQLLDIIVRPDAVDRDGLEVGQVGVAPLLQRVQYPALAAFGPALKQTGETTMLTLGVLGKMVTGQVSMSNLSGPITIATVAGRSAEIGWHRFVYVLALLSVSLGVLNLLPIPILDGGHILFCLAEIAKGGPVSERTQALGMQVGLFLVGGLMVLALYNDVVRLL